MDYSSFMWWMFWNLVSMAVLAFYSMGEMACVSLNKIRMHYYVSKGIKRAIWLTYLMQDPARLFGTTLICVNAAMMIGSEFARKSYESLGINPDLAPLTQVTLVIIFAELAPMFAARRYPEHVAMLGAPILYATAKLMTPLLWLLGQISKLANILVGGQETDSNAVLNREDLQKILEEQDEDRTPDSEGPDFNTVTWNIFSLKNKDARHVMQPINPILMLPSTATVEQYRNLLKQHDVDSVLIYHRDVSHIVGIATPRDLIRAMDAKRIRDFADAPWFITQQMNVIQILKDFRRNNKSIAIVLNVQGHAVGMITIGDLIDEIFGEFKESLDVEPAEQGLMIDRTFPGDMTVGEFNKQFEVQLDSREDLTLAELMIEELGHPPEEGESIYLPPFELTVKESTLMDIKKVTIVTRL